MNKYIHIFVTSSMFSSSFLRWHIAAATPANGNERRLSHSGLFYCVMQ